MNNPLSDSFELDVKAALRLIDNDTALFAELAKIYLDTVPSQVVQLKGFLARGSIADAKIIVHTVKSTSRSMGAFGLGTVAESMERSLNIGDLAAARVEMPELERLFGLVKKALDEVVNCYK